MVLSPESLLEQTMIEAKTVGRTTADALKVAQADLTNQIRILHDIIDADLVAPSQKAIMGEQVFALIVQLQHTLIGLNGLVHEYVGDQQATTNTAQLTLLEDEVDFYSTDHGMEDYSQPARPWAGSDDFLGR